MGPTKIMIIRHAEKPGSYGGEEYQGINAIGETDEESLITIGWGRAGALANLFDPSNGKFQSSELSAPDFIYAADPCVHHKEPSQRPYQTVQPLSSKINTSINASFKKKHYKKMVKDVLEFSTNKSSLAVLISWQHDDILPKDAGENSILTEINEKTGSNLSIPSEPWPEDRYDMVMVLNRPSGEGPFTGVIQVPQMLLAGDSAKPIN